MPPISSGGVGLIEQLNILEGYDLKALGFRSAASTHLMIEAMRRSFADRARYLGDPDFVPDMPIAKLISKEYAADAPRRRSQPTRASVSSPTSFEWPAESDETTHLSVVDRDRNAVSLTYTLEAGYGSKIVVPGAGFLLNNEMGDFNAGPGLTTADGLIGTEPNLAAPGKRMLSSMTPTILSKDGKLFMVTGSPGGRTIINTVVADGAQRHRLRDERAGGGGRAAPPPPVAARPDRLRAVRPVARHAEDPRGNGPHAAPDRRAGRRRGDRRRSARRHAAGRLRPARRGRRRGRESGRTTSGSAGLAVPEPRALAGPCQCFR